LDELRHRAPRLFHRNPVVRPVHLVEIDMIGLQAGQ
jgi:hypothetical protein